jgi:hypothetical protein
MSTIPSTGELNFSTIRNIMGGTGAINMSQYYQNAASGFTSGVTGIPNTGNSISFSVFRGKSKTPVTITIPSQGLTNYTTTLSGTSTMAGTYVVSASSEYNTSEASFKVFDKISSRWTIAYGNHTFYKGTGATYTGTFTTTISGTARPGEWIQLKIPTAAKLVSYTIDAGLNSARAPVGFQMAGSTDGTTWTLLDSRTGVSWTSVGIQTFSATQSLTNSYDHLRLVVNQIASSAGFSFLSINEISFSMSL